MDAWYFSTETKRLRFGDDREIAVGVTHSIEGEPWLCDRGLHASVKALDALSYAPGPIVWRVRLGGTILTGDDKLCATERTYLSGGIDASETLRLFARKCALDVAHLWDAPQVVIDYLNTGDESIRAAAKEAVWAGGAARDAAWDAAWGAARDAAWIAARAAARAAAWAAAWDAARDVQNSRLESMLNDLIGT